MFANLAWQKQLLSNIDLLDETDITCEKKVMIDLKSLTLKKCFEIDEKKRSKNAEMKQSKL